MNTSSAQNLNHPLIYNRKTLAGIYADQVLDIVQIERDIFIDLAKTTWTSNKAIATAITSIITQVVGMCDVSDHICLHSVGEYGNVNPGVAILCPTSFTMTREQESQIAICIVRFLKRVLRNADADSKTKTIDESLIDGNKQYFIDELSTTFLGTFGGLDTECSMRVEFCGNGIAMIPPGKFLPKPKTEASQPGDDFVLQGSFRAIDVDARSLGIRENGKRGKTKLQFDEENDLDLIREKLGNGIVYRVNVRQELLANGTLANVVSSIEAIAPTQDGKTAIQDLFSGLP